MSQHQPPIVVLTGPTGVGKSALGVEIAARLGLEILSADSRQVYRQLDIGTAKPTPTERALVPHHLIDYVDPDETYSVARFRDDAERVLAGLARRNVGALIVGGTGHYIQAAVDGIAPPAVPPRPELRAKLERFAAERGADALHRQLATLDSVAAEMIPPSNVRRVIRALEVIRATCAPFSTVGRARTRPRAALKLVLTMARRELYRRADARIEAMLAAGWLDEVRGLLARGYDPSLPAMSSTGYRELIAHLDGRLSLADAVQRIKWATHAYIRRQYVWLRRQSGYEWIDAGPAGYARLTALAERHLAAYSAGHQHRGSTTCPSL